jgi:hypothetical protein
MRPDFCPYLSIQLAFGAQSPFQLQLWVYLCARNSCTTYQMNPWWRHGRSLKHDSWHDRSPSSCQKFSLSTVDSFYVCHGLHIQGFQFPLWGRSFFLVVVIVAVQNCLYDINSHMYNVLYSSCHMWHDIQLRLIGSTFCVQWCWQFTLCNGGSSYLMF